MRNMMRCLIGVAVGTWLSAGLAHAQETSNTIGPPQLRDFQLRPKQTIVTQPDPNQAPVRIAPPPPTRSAPTSQPAQAARNQTRSPAAAARRAPEQAQQAPPTVQTAPAAPQQNLAPPAFETQPPADVALPPAVEEKAPSAADVPAEGSAWWLYALGLALAGLGGWALLRRRGASAAARPHEPELVPAVPVAAPVAPRPDPVPRPWLELELKTERASFTAAEAVVAFELAIANTGGSPARNLRIDVKMFNAGREQDREIGSFFKTAGRESTKLNLPGIGADSTGVIRGEVAMPLEEMRAVKLDGRMLFIPVVAVNLLYDWGNGRTGHSAKSYVIGRELQESPEKMGAFRVDQGPRIWRTVGQRPHTLAKRA